MTDRKSPGEENEDPEDVETLYSWANLHGARYREFSASRAQMREKAKQRVQDAIEEGRRREREEAEALRAAEEQRVAEAARAAEDERQAELAAQPATQQAPAAAQQRAWQQAWPDRFKAPSATPVPTPAPAWPLQAQPPGHPSYAPSSTPRTPAPIAQNPAAKEVPFSQPPGSWAGSDSRDGVSLPAWLAPERVDLPSQPVPQEPDDTLQGSRDRLTSRWFALKGVFDANSAPAEPLPAHAASRAPVLAVFSLAGGVGKTSLVATLGRALSSRGERVLLVDTATYGLLPFYFGARDQRPGLLRTFTPPGASGDAPIQLVAIDPESLAPETASQETLAQEISHHSRGVSRILVDLATASGAIMRRIIRMAPTVLVPIVPDMSSVVSIGAIEAFFRQSTSAAARQVLPLYLLNQFDYSLPLHLDVREVLRERIGDRLLPFVLRRAPSVSEALAEGMTVMDYAPNSTVAEDYGSLAGWVKSVAAPASTGYRGVRWSER
jgi:cellulose synthase operon protein YhjQ